METPKAVANYFLKKSFDTGIEVTPMKALKLVYLAHGWYLGFKEEDLINEVVEAWQYGPVIKSVYREFKAYGNEQISRLASLVESVDNDPFTFRSITPNIGEDKTEIKSLLNLVWDSYKNYTGLQLSSITHQPNSPWDIVYNQRGGKDKKSAIIGNDIIKKYYRDKVLQLNLPNNQKPATP